MQKNNNTNMQQALQQVSRLCSKQEKCKYDIIRALQLKNINEEDIEKIISQLVNDKFIDEQRYAEFFVRDKIKFPKWGRIKIRYELTRKEISEKEINAAINSIDEDEYNNTLSVLLKNKLRTFIKLPVTDQKAKLIRFAASKGYENELIYHVIKQLINY